MASKPSYVADTSRPSGRAVGRSYEAKVPEKEVLLKPKYKSMAEKMGYMSPSERMEAGAGSVGQITPAVNPNMNSRVSKADIEPAPSGFSPSHFLKEQITEFLENPQCKNGGMLYRRVKFEQRDVPSVDYSEATLYKVEPKLLLGSIVDRSRVNLFIKFASPSPDTTLKVLEQILTLLSMWDQNTDDVVLVAPNIQEQGRIRYQRKITVFSSFDFSNEVAVVVV